MAYCHDHSCNNCLECAMKKQTDAIIKAIMEKPNHFGYEGTVQHVTYYDGEIHVKSFPLSDIYIKPKKQNRLIRFLFGWLK